MFDEIFTFFIRLLSLIIGKGSGSKSIRTELNQVKRVFEGLRHDPRMCVDIGGNIGDYSKRLRKVFPKSEILIVEPSTKCFEELVNEFSKDPMVSIQKVAICDREGAAVLYSDVEGSGLTALTKRNLDHLNINFERRQDTVTTTFDILWAKLNGQNQKGVDFVKIDIEGAELAALEGMKKNIDTIKVIQFEFGGANVDTRTFFRDLWVFFFKHKFDIYRIAPIGLIKIQRYSTNLEFFDTTNYIAVNQRYSNATR